MNAPQRPKIAAIILAAGYSSRMQGWKPLLPLGNSTVIEQAIAMFRQTGIDEIVVVAGHRSAELSEALQKMPVRCVVNEQYDRGMYRSVATGVRALAPDTAAFFLLPVDVPLVKRRTIRLLIRHFFLGKGKIIYPVFRGQRGHPPLISTAFAPMIMDGDRSGGLRSLLEEYESAAAEVQIPDEGILMDMDEPSDYGRMQERFLQRDIPSQAECQAIWELVGTEPQTVKHSRQVARVAARLATVLNDKGLRLNVPLLVAAGLLHDLAKGRKNHARTGGRILRGLGYGRVADLVECHMDLEFSPGAKLDEASLLYLADKLTLEDKIVPVDERLAFALTRYKADGPTLGAVMRRLTTAKNIEAAVGKVSGCQVENMVMTGVD